MKRAYSDGYLSQTMWNHTKNLMKKLKRANSLFLLRRSLSTATHFSLQKVNFESASKVVPNDCNDMFWCISITNNVKSCKKFSEKAQTGYNGKSALWCWKHGKIRNTGQTKTQITQRSLLIVLIGTFIRCMFKVLTVHFGLKMISEYFRRISTWF